MTKKYSTMRKRESFSFENIHPSEIWLLERIVNWLIEKKSQKCMGPLRNCPYVFPFQNTDYTQHCSAPFGPLSDYALGLPSSKEMNKNGFWVGVVGSWGGLNAAPAIPYTEILSITYQISSKLGQNAKVGCLVGFWMGALGAQKWPPYTISSFYRSVT